MNPLVRLRTGLRGGEEQDPWGYDPAYTEALQPAFDTLFDRWWRVRVSGAGQVPADGPALVVANHAGLLPWDAAMLTTAICRAWADAPGAGGRRPRFLLGDEATRVPWLGVGIRRLGGVPAGPINAARLLDEGHTVLAFPEGSRAAGKAWGERYRLLRFGRGGFAETAIRAGVPIVPCGIVGGEEAYPHLGQLPGLAKLTGLPAVPLTPTFPLLGPLGLVPLPSKWHIAFGEPITTAELGVAAADERAVVLSVAEQARASVLDLVEAALVRRTRTFL